MTLELGYPLSWAAILHMALSWILRLGTPTNHIILCASLYTHILEDVP